MFLGSAQLQSLEEDRISKMSEYLNQYNSHMSVMGPKITQSCDILNEAVVAVDLQGDLRTVVQKKGSGVSASEQILIDCYAEDMQFSMKPERRKNSLQNYLLFIRQSIERERKGREGVEKLVEVYNQRPGFADPETQIETKQRLLQVTYMMNFLEASHFKLANSFATLDKQQKMEHKFAQYIETTRDKQGVTVSTLRLPANLASEGNSGYDVTSVTLTTLASQGNENETGFADDEFETESIGQCRALYDYEATHHDELTISEGDIINLYDKQQDGWWQGECGEGAISGESTMYSRLAEGAISGESKMYSRLAEGAISGEYTMYSRLAEGAISGESTMYSRLAEGAISGESTM
ncbi:NOSTRIN [Mytilus coruscus]|uniref:NOSTRIN n=1 Tax=Mytilus coruscus TaxID=42192 RepID=A0A6J8C0F1_MYTCO|nr:NOSTRIN [Mytilus coruscus]